MWIKIDDGFATHPKVLSAGAIPALIQIRAICYASQHKTDGFIPNEAVSLLLTGLSTIKCFNKITEQYDNASEIDLASLLCTSGLWKQGPLGYVVHDYLEWNVSKYEYESFTNKKKKAGKKGMKARWGKGLRPITSVITDAITDAITKPYHPISTVSCVINPLNSLSSPPPQPLITSEIKSKNCARNFKEDAREVLNFLNEKAGKKFREVEANLSIIEARLKSGVEVQDCKTLIARKVRDWTPKPEMVGYLRPETLFNKTKFETYLAEVSS